MAIILNIGLEAFVNDRVVAIEPASIKRNLELTLGLSIAHTALVESHTEQTLVVVAEPWAGSRGHQLYDVYQLAVAFNQDAIAYYDEADGYGELIGPNAKAWGPFNSEFFFLADGRSLHDHIVAKQIEEVTNG